MHRIPVYVSGYDYSLVFRLTAAVNHVKNDQKQGVSNGLSGPEAHIVKAHDASVPLRDCISAPSVKYIAGAQERSWRHRPEARQRIKLANGLISTEAPAHKGKISFPLHGFILGKITCNSVREDNPGYHRVIWQNRKFLSVRQNRQKGQDNSRNCQ